MKFRIEKIRTVVGTNLLYVDVAFLEDNQVIHRNDFVMQLKPTHTVYIGRVGPNGEPLDKGAEYFEEHDTDSAAEIVANIQAYASRASMRRLDNRDRNLSVEDTDPLGLRVRPAVAALIRVEVNV
jgi:hypothetical protein